MQQVISYKNKKSNKVFSLFKISLLLLLLQSMFAWFLWGVYTAFFVNLLPLVLAFILFLSDKNRYKITIFNAICIFLIVIIQLYIVREFKMTAFILSLLRIGNISSVLLLNNNDKKKLFIFFTKSIAVILTVSLIGWVLFLLGVNLPYYSIESDYGPYNNYYFFILFKEDSIFSIIPRFSSIFLEPGYLGMLTSILIVTNKFQFKKKATLIFLLATIFSFSLAAFLVIIISSIIYILSTSKKSMLYIFSFIILLFTLYKISVVLNDGDNAIYNYLFKRLEFSNGTISGYNRFSSDLDSYYNSFINSSNIYFGIGEQEFRKLSWEGGNAGYKVFLIQYGLVGTTLVFLFHLVLVLSVNYKQSWLLFMVYILIFLQAAYPLIESELLLFITSIPFFKPLQDKKTINQRI